MYTLGGWLWARPHRPACIVVGSAGLWLWLAGAGLAGSLLGGLHWGGGGSKPPPTHTPAGVAGSIIHNSG